MQAPEAILVQKMLHDWHWVICARNKTWHNIFLQLSWKTSQINTLQVADYAVSHKISFAQSFAHFAPEGSLKDRTKFDFVGGHSKVSFARWAARSPGCHHQLETFRALDQNPGAIRKLPHRPFQPAPTSIAPARRTEHSGCDKVLKKGAKCKKERTLCDIRVDARNRFSKLAFWALWFLQLWAWKVIVPNEQLFRSKFLRCQGLGFCNICLSDKIQGYLVKTVR